MTTPLTPEQWQRVLDHRHLVERVVRRRWRTDLDDARQDGLLGLCRAVQLDKGSPDTFDAYAMGWISQAIQQGRRRFEGINFRRSTDRGERWEQVGTLDIEVGNPANDERDTIARLLPETSPGPEERALAAITLADAAGHLFAAARDAIDVDVACALVADPGGRLGDQDRAIAAAHSIPTTRVAARRRRLRAEAAA